MTHIFSREFQDITNLNQAEDKPSELLNLLWNGRFADELPSEASLQRLFLEKNASYREILMSAYSDELRRVKNMPAQGRSYIESYPNAMKRFELKMERNYRFITNPIREEQFVMNHSIMLMHQIVKNIQEREAEGIE